MTDDGRRDVPRLCAWCVVRGIVFKLSVIIPGVLVPLLAVFGVWSGLLPLAGANATPEDPVGGIEDPIDPNVDPGEDNEGNGGPNDPPSIEPTPTPIPVDPNDPDLVIDADPSPFEAPGYLTALQNGIALVQTSRRNSPVHHGWVDITLDLVLTSFVDDPEFTPSVSVSEDNTKVCFATDLERRDCFWVQWGSDEQFIAELRPVGTANPEWAPGKAQVWAVVFEVPGNAQLAALRFGNNRVEIALGGQVEDDTSGHVEGESQRPPHRPFAPPGTDGYFLGEAHGIAVTSVSREPHEEQPSWVKVHVDLDVMRYETDKAIDTAITTETSVEEACLVASPTRDCMRIHWGYGDAYDAIVTSVNSDAERFWPRAKGWPHRLTLVVPENIYQATLHYGGHEIALDLLGESAPSPDWDYTEHYRPLTGLTLHDDREHSVDLVAVDRDTVTADVILRFEAANRSENRDFYPRITFEGGRVSQGGAVFDGMDAVQNGWDAVSFAVQGGPIAPGHREEITMVLPRVGGNGFVPVGHSDDPPDAMLVRLSADDNVHNEPVADSVRRFEPYYISFERKPGDADATYFYPDLAITRVGLSETPPTASEPIDVVFTVANLGPRNALASSLDFYVNDAFVQNVPVPAIDAHKTTAIHVPWTTTLATATFDAVLDPDDVVEEAIVDNNEARYQFAGGVQPDLVVDSVTLLPPEGTQKTRFAVEVRNAGLGRSPGSQVLARLSNGGQFFLSFPPLESGESAVREYNWLAAMGRVPVTLTVDGVGAIAESDETNNETLALMPDLTYTEGTRLLLDEGGRPRIEATITNIGQHPSPVVTVRVLLNGVEIMGTFDVGPLAPGETATVTSPTVPKDDRNNIQVVIDPTGLMPESDESNNVLSFNYVAAPLSDLIVESAIIKTTMIDNTPRYSLEFYVENAGTRRSEATTVELWDVDADELIATIDLPAVLTGESRWSYHHWEVGETFGDLLLVIDPDETLDELIEENNTKFVPAP